MRNEQLGKAYNQVMELQLIAIISIGTSCKRELSPEDQNLCGEWREGDISEVSREVVGQIDFLSKFSLVSCDTPTTSSQGKKERQENK